MTELERIAHHEAAHAVLTILAGLDVAAEGIDLAYTNPSTGSSGGLFGNLFDIDLSALKSPELETQQQENMKEINLNGAIVAAGAASDAKLLGLDPWEALQEQPSDLRMMRNLLKRAQLSSSPKVEEAHIRSQLREAVLALQNPIFWEAIEAVATAVLTRSPLPGTDIETIAVPILKRFH